MKERISEVSAQVMDNAAATDRNQETAIQAAAAAAAAANDAADAQAAVAAVKEAFDISQIEQNKEPSRAPVCAHSPYVSPSSPQGTA